MAKKNTGGRALVILMAGLILVVFLITALANANLGPVIAIVTDAVERAAEGAGELGESVSDGASRLNSRPLAEGIADYLKQGEALAIPDGDAYEILEREGFILAFDRELGIARWVGYLLTAEELTGEVERTDYFREDPSLGEDAPDPDDYRGSGYDRGHLIPAGDVKWSLTAMEDSFLSSNIAPQVPELNRGAWRMLEEAIRELAEREELVVVITGPVLAEKEYPRLAEAGTVIPEFYFKVVLDFTGPELGAWGFIMPNDAALMQDREYGDFLFTVDQVEDYAGFDFFSVLPDETEARLERASYEIF